MTSRPPQGGWIEIWLGFFSQIPRESPAPHRAGGLKWRILIDAGAYSSPAPHRAGGLKFLLDQDRSRAIRSRPPQGGWIEIDKNEHRGGAPLSRPPQGGWIEIRRTGRSKRWLRGPAPHRAGGLKCFLILSGILVARCPAPHRAGGLKSQGDGVTSHARRVPPPTGRVD